MLVNNMSKANSKGMSRQRAWQLAKRAAGLCIRCGLKPLLTKNHCARCAKKQREYMRSVTGAERRYKNSQSYQKTTGK